MVNEIFIVQNIHKLLGWYINELDCLLLIYLYFLRSIIFKIRNLFNFF